MKKNVLFLMILLLSVWVSNGQQLKSKSGLTLPQPVCKASGKVEKSFIPPPESSLLKSVDPKCDIDVTYIGFSILAKNAFEYAVNIWESIIESDMTIRMKATWSSNLDSDVLGSCGPETYYANFTNAPYEDLYYPVAIAEKIANKELNGESRYDIVANFSSSIDWYYGTDGNTPDTQYDLVTVALHEIAHGLGFTGFFFVDNDLGVYGYYDYGDATSFDRLVVRSSGIQLLDTTAYPNQSSELASALQSAGLYAESPIAKASNNGTRPRLYAPTTFDDGSSVYHLNDNTYPTGNENSLMTHALGYGEAVHDPGPLARGIMEDIGWTNLIIHFDPIKDKEELQPVTFNVSFDSEYDIDSSALYVIYSTDEFQTLSDTLNLVSENSDGIFSATLSPGENTEIITYYIEARDVKDRVKYAPSLAPKEYYQVKFGPDTQSPSISHTPVDYFLKRGESLTISAEVSDNLGVDTVYVEYSINNVQQSPFGLPFVEDDTYFAEFPFNLETLSDGDSIHYKIYAIDSSLAKNMAQLPDSDESFAFRVEEIFDPVSSYENDFNSETSDFLISDFSIYTANNFEDGALHSPHPYESPGVDNEEYNYTTFLKRPIIIKESGSITFDEVVLVEPGESGSEYGDDDFWDYVIVEGSKDFGETWLELADGYDSGDNTVWKENYNTYILGQDSKTKGKSEWFENREISLVENQNFVDGDTILIRFRLYSDPYAAGWGWAIDNLRIQKPLAAGYTNLSEDDVLIYPNPFNSKINLKLTSSENVEELKIEVFNLFGQKVYATVEKDVFGQLNREIELSQLGNGMYLVKVSVNGKQVLSKKLIKN